MRNYKKWIPNILTSTRILLTPIIIYLGLTNQLEILIGIAIIVALTDYFDGHLARKWNVQSSFGAKLDAVADKVLVIGLLTILIIQNHSFFYVLALECFIASLNLYFYLKKGIANSLMIGKIKTWVVFTTIIIGLLDLFFAWQIKVNYLIYFTVVWQIGSLISYIKNYIDLKSKKKN